MRKRLVTGFVLLAGGAYSGTFEDAVVEQLLCKKQPQPAPIIHALAEAKLVDLEKGYGADSVSCFPLASPLPIKGMTFTSICGFDDDKQTLKQFPGIFYRGPGTSPGRELTLHSMASEAELADWYRGIGGTKTNIVGTPYVTETNERSSVTCSQWTAGGQGRR